MATGDRRTLDNLKFVNGALRSLPIDSIKENYVRSVQGVCVWVCICQLSCLGS